MTPDCTTGTSKLLSYLLRHRPDSVGLQLDANGWADVDELLRRLAEDGKPVTRDLLDRVVARRSRVRSQIISSSK